MKNSTILLIILGIVLVAYFTRPAQNFQNDNLASTGRKVQDGSTSGTESISTNNYANTTLQYYYYIPKSISQSSTKSVRYLIMVPGLSGAGQDFVTQPFKSFAKKEDFVIIAPSFVEDSKNWDSQTSYQYPDAWSGEALNNIIKNFGSKHNLAPSYIYMLGFSAGAQFVSRYSLIYPNYVAACAFNSAGGSYDPKNYISTKFFIAIGTKDEPDRLNVARNFYTLAKQNNIDATYKEYPIGHEYTDAEINDELAFFRLVKSSEK